MPEQRSKRTETEDVTHVDSLLSLLGDLSKRDPSPVLRERLSILAVERLSRDPHNVRRRPQVWLKPAIASACLVAAGLAAGLAAHFLERKPAQNDGTAAVSSPVVSPEIKVHSVPSVQTSVSKPRKVHHSRAVPIEPTGPRQMTVRLPYSNNAIETGTGTTIRVSMSQSDLLSLGFPINTTVQDRRIVAELTLGDDGLPRAISLPLPLEVMKEKK
jgi:hypothetical protein